MKYVCCLLFGVVFIMDSALASAAQNVSRELEALKRVYEEGGEKGGEKLRLVADVTRSIQQYIRGADDNDWATPSAERLRRLGEIADAVQPYASLLIDLGTPTPSGDSNPNTLGLLYFARPTIELKRELLKLANTPKVHGAAATAYDIIFNLGMGTPDVREEIAKRMSGYQENSNRTTVAESLFYDAGAQWRMPEAVLLYVEVLARESRNKEQLNTRVRAVANAVRPLGQQAAAVLPLLQEHLTRMKAENADPQTIGVIEGAIRAVEGKEPIEPLLCVSGAGLVSEGGIRRSVSIPAASSLPVTATSVPSIAPAASPQPATPAGEKPAFPAEHRSSTWRWVVGILVLIAIVAVALKRRA